MRTASRWIGLIVAIGLLVSPWGLVRAQTSGYEYFAETGHNVQGEFLRYYRSVSNPVLVFGYPITEQYTDRGGKIVQYFQRARFEQDPDLPAGGQVQLTPLGRETYTPSGQLNINNPFACRTFEQTGYAVCFAFLEFFDENGGVQQFGYPISPFEFHNNLIVQYFENARFEWRPGEGEGQRVGLTDLGRIYFDQSGEDPALLRAANPPDARIRPVLSLQMRAFASKAVSLSSDQQSIYVIIQDQNLQPVAKATGTATIRFPNGETRSMGFSTNNNGVGILSFDFSNQPNGRLVFIDITTFYNGLQGSTKTSFRIWY